MEFTMKDLMKENEIHGILKDINLDNLIQFFGDEFEDGWVKKLGYELRPDTPYTAEQLENGEHYKMAKDILLNWTYLWGNLEGLVKEYKKSKAPHSRLNIARNATAKEISWVPFHPKLEAMGVSAFRKWLAS